jgi:D-tyrosyl-tRNA(Tyr) deacylase
MDSIPPLVDKIVKMRIFSNADGKFDKDVTQIDGEILAVSQFTLYADTSRGRRPEFIQAMKPEPARALFDAFVSALKTSGVRNVATGVFGAMMEVSLVNDGPVTITVER